MYEAWNLHRAHTPCIQHRPLAKSCMQLWTSARRWRLVAVGLRRLSACADSLDFCRLVGQEEAAVRTRWLGHGFRGSRLRGVTLGVSETITSCKYTSYKHILVECDGHPLRHLIGESGNTPGTASPRRVRVGEPTRRRGLPPWYVALLLAAALAPRAAGADDAFAPLSARNLYPPRVVFIQPAPALPEPRPGWGLELAYATVLVEEDRPGASLLVDLEVARVAAVGSARTPWGGALSVEVPYLRYGGGAFDRVLMAYHDALGFPDGGRPDRPENAFAYEIQRGDQGYSPDPPAGGGLGDVVLGALQPAWASPSGAVRAATRVSLKLPTGSRNQGFGSGRIDGGLGILASWTGRRGGLTVNADALYLGGEADPALRLATRWSFSSLLALALRLGDRWTASAQVHFTASPYGAGFSSLDQDVLLLAAGLRRQVGSRAWASLGFTEDLIVESSPDFALLAGLEW